MPDLPSGTVTFLFTDIEGSTRRWQRDPARMRSAVQHHDALLLQTIASHHGVLYKHTGDAAQSAFPSPRLALLAAASAQDALIRNDLAETDRLKVRMALHVGEAAPTADGDYHQVACLNRLARLLDAGHGGQILVSDAVSQLVADDPPLDLTLRELGTFRLRDLLEPETIWQLEAPTLPKTFPALRTLDRQSTNLPVQPTALIGRASEIVELTALIRGGDVRLVTLTGPGGTGKTRLAAHVSAEVLDAFSGGVWFVDLTPLRDPALVVSTIATTLGIRESPDSPIRERLIAALRDQQVLIVLDNCEQLLAAASDLAAILAGCPDVVVLATSREPWHLRAEQEVPVLPLAVPEAHITPAAETLAAVPAVTLFVQRAQAVNPRFGLTPDNMVAVAEICRRLDGLPLAIELAAARSKLLPPTALLPRLERRLPVLTGGARDLPDRQRTLRDTIAWSYDLLSLEEQTLFRRLSVFAGGWTVDSADTVTNPDGLLDVLDDLGSLVDKNLVRPIEAGAGEPRFTMLETIREYGLEQLVRSGEEASVREAHAAWCLQLAAAAEAELWGPRQAAALGRLKVEIDNLRAALRWADEWHHDELILHLAGVLGIFWQIHGYAAEGSRWVKPVLARHHMASVEATAHGYFAAGLLDWISGDYAGGITACSASAERWRTVGDTWHEALALNVLGMLRGEQGDYLGARQDLEQSLNLCHAIGHEWGIGLALFDIGKALTYEHAYDEAAPWIEASLPHFRASGDHWQTAESLADLAGIAQVRRDVDRVAVLASESLRINRAQGWLWYVPESLELLGGVALARGDHAGAARLLGAVEARREAAAAVRQPLFRDPYAQHVATLQAVLGPDRFRAIWAAGRALSVDEAMDEALAIASTPVERPPDEEMR